ncbi:MAG: glucosaminidase domain-containing protein [Chloroflexaceae bacterium]|nr:glucosaminidase domain-containing protein [Chloroflexaceae bacterium]
MHAVPVATAQSSELCFQETGYCISGRIRTYWEAQGGLRVFGLPIGAQVSVLIEGKMLTMQQFERNRLELHPNNAAPYDVQLGRLGADRLQQQKGVSESESLALFGLPLSGVMTERLSDGKEYQVQWFERARFELHPENTDPYDVLFGLLGNEMRDYVPVTPLTDAPILGTASGTVAEAVRVLAPRAAANGYAYDDVVSIVKAYEQVGSSVGVDWFLAIAQMAHETGFMTSFWSARPQRNPAGLGVEGRSSTTDPNQPGWVFNSQRNMWEKGLSFASWEEEAIPAHIGRMLAYALRDDQATPAQKAMIDKALAYRALPANLRGVAPTIVGLNGRWAYPGTTYGQRILAVMLRLRQAP